MSIQLPTPSSGLHGVPRLGADAPKPTRKDYASDQEVRWCPGCGDYAILAAMQSFLPEMGLRRENVAFISGIGCSSRFPYYLNTYGMHSIHGRAPAIATGLATAREDLSVWVITGDGDALSIGGNHLIHALRRNVNLNILLFNNQIYGLTKGQYSPTSKQGLITKSSPVGSLDQPFNPLQLAIGAGATFVARTLDSDRAHLTATLRAASEHRGTSFIEIYQNCPIFNDGVFESLKDNDEARMRMLPLKQGEPIRSADDHFVVVRDGAAYDVVGAHSTDDEIVVHDATLDNPAHAFALAGIDDAEFNHVPMGVLRSIDRPAYDDQVRSQVASATAEAGGATDAEDLATLLRGRDSWTIDPTN
ncbi:MAG: 2-oxoacid:ferredoxin oxidoreductase subunit beta [Dermatophilus congolensis]|nr:2-oxoacid:ferredoxin oxidoreductase subunit beta [Dermatophilus congolensis]